MEILAEEFVRQGHEVKLVSQISYQGPKQFSFEVIRRPGPIRLLRLIGWCEIFFQAHMSLKGAWPLIFKRRPWVVAHNAWYARDDGRLGWQDHLKQFAARFATGISVSHAVAAHVRTPSEVIPNTYREDIFRLLPDVARDKELVFLGRLVSAKGADLLLSALGCLKKRGLAPRLTIIGSGPEEPELRRQAEDLGIADQIVFAGVKVEAELAQLLNAHKILVAPSRWQEPFGIVALEAIACGCVVIGSEGGGLKDAIGACGITFPNGDVEGLADRLADLLTRHDKMAVFRAAAEAHLSRHTKSAIAAAYLQVFKNALE